MKKKKILKKNKALKKQNKKLRRDLDSFSSENLSVALESEYYKERAEELEDELERIRAGEKRESGDRSLKEIPKLWIDDVVWNGDETTIVWCDKTSTTVRRQKEDAYDKHTAVAYAIAKKVLSSDLSETVRYYSEEEKRKRKEEALKVYMCLQSGCKERRRCAGKKWALVPRPVRQSVKAIAKNTGTEES